VGSQSEDRNHGRGNKQEEIQEVKLQEDLITMHDQSQLVMAVQCLPHSIKDLLWNI